MSKGRGSSGFSEGWKLCVNLIRRRLAIHRTAQRESGALSRAGEAVYGAAERALAHLQASARGGIGSEVFETHRSCIVRLYLPEGMSPEELHIQIEPTQVTVSADGLLQADMIRLPAPVWSRNGKRIYHNGVLELKLRKASR